jgi:outer membrane biosynthesis protein TonB
MAISMSPVPLADDDQLRREIYETEEKLSGLKRDLSGIDAELDSLGEQRETYELLEQACGSLEKLDALGAAELFWGQGGQGRTVEQVRQARDRAGQFLGRIGEIESRRQAVADRIRQGQEVLEILEADLFELELEEEERKQEWQVERELAVPQRAAYMPWAKGEDDRRLRKSLAANLLLALLIGAIVPIIDLPLPDLELLPEVPERFARLIDRELPPPPPPVIEEPAPEEVVPEPEPVVAEELPEEVPEIPVEPAPTVAEEPAPAPEPEVRSAGILAFRESFANLDTRQAAELGAQARINAAGEAAVGRTERSMVTTQGPGSSGGINLSNLSRDVGGGGTGQGLDGVQVTRVASSIGGSGTGDRPTAAGTAAAGRTDEEIQIVFDRYKAALYRLYNRELRNDPTLRGQIVLRLTIEADGRVSFLEVERSDMGAPALEQQVADRVREFDFGAKTGISAVTILYPIDFLPAA